MHPVNAYNILKAQYKSLTQYVSFMGDARILALAEEQVMPEVWKTLDALVAPHDRLNIAIAEREAREQAQ